MFLAPNCPGCGGRRHLEWPAHVAPFIEEYVLAESAGKCNLRECLDCGLRYFDRRYTADEMRRLYEDYRGDRYVRIRRKCEPGYDNTAAIGDVSLRRATLNDFLRHNLGKTFSGPVLDFGGDEGQFIPDFFTGERYVHDVTTKPLVGGAKRISDLAELEGRPPAFVLCCHVLEHLPEPIEVLNTISGFLPRGGKIYVEVPNERIRLRWIGDSRLYRRCFDFLNRQSLTAPAIIALVRLLARAGKSIPPLIDPPLHEHINFFHQRSLTALLVRAQYRIVAFREDTAVHRVLAEKT